MRNKCLLLVLIIALFSNTMVVFANDNINNDDSTIVVDYGGDGRDMYALLENGNLFVWNLTSGNTPRIILKKVKKVSYGTYGHNAAITENGDLYCWGENNDGEVGNGDVDVYGVEKPVKVLSNVKEVYRAENLTSAITENGDLYCWGENTYGRVGCGEGIRNQSTPFKVLSKVKSFYCNEYWNSMAITENGDLYIWGNNSYGLIGNGDKENQYIPYKVLHGVKQIDCDISHILALTETGELFCWGGNNACGCLGTGTTEDQLTPYKVLEKVDSFSIGGPHMAAITMNGDLYCWGKNEDGQIGNGTKDNQLSPTKVMTKCKKVLATDSAGIGMTSAITINGDLYCWGSNISGCAGCGSEGFWVLNPVKVLANVEDIVGIDGYAKAAITVDGDLYCWGHNYYGGVGNGTNKTQLIPVKVLQNVHSFKYATITSTSVALTNSGDLYHWGENTDGKEGCYLVPTKIDFDNKALIPTTSAIDTFYYASGDKKDYTALFYYNDSYFYDSARNYNSSLATMSMCMALSAFGSNRTRNEEDPYINKSQNLKDLLTKCGFQEENFVINNYYKIKPQTDSIGVGISRKDITDKNGKSITLIAVGVRGGGYESEWASNFTLGESGTHKGFTKARDEVLNTIKSYIINNKEDIKENVKIWIAGYSRAAATTNLVAASLDDGYLKDSGVNISSDDIYAFCFESPQGALKGDVDQYKYNNITCILNPVDVVTKVAPTEPSSGFGFYRYGRQKYLPTKLTAGNYQYDYYANRMLQYYNNLESTEDYIVDDFQMKKISVNNILWDTNGWLKEGIVVNDNDSKWDQEAFLDSSLFYLFSSITSRQNYVKIYENDIREICSVVFGIDDNKKIIFNKKLEDSFIKDIMGIMACIVTGNKNALTKRIADDIVKTMNECDITSYSTTQVKSASEKIASLLLKFGISHPNFTASMISNIKGIGAAHYPELCLAWLMSFDSNYNSMNKEHFCTGAYRVIRINCPVDITVFDSYDLSVGKIINDKVDDANNGIICFINDEGEKLVYLPIDEEYKIEIIPTANGKMDYSICEYSEDFGGFERVVNYYNVPLVKGEKYESIIPAADSEDINNLWETGTDLKYELVDNNGNEIKTDKEVKGDNVTSQTFSVVVEANDSSFGNVSGDNIVLVGGYAQVNAAPNDGYEFLGWYENETKISSELTYRFLVLKDTKLMAHFGTSNEKQDDDNNSVSENAASVQIEGDSNNVLQGNTNTSVQYEEVSPVIAPERIKIKKIKNTAKKTITIKYKNIKARGYQIQIASNKKFKKGKKNKYTTETTVKIKKLKKGKTYYIRVRAYNMNGTKKLYGQWSVVKKIKIKK